MLNRGKTVLIITGCVTPNKDMSFLAVKDSKLRYEQYINSIKFFLDNSLFTNIVFCDNSECKINESLVFYADKINKKLEWLSFAGDDIQQLNKGKGFGEGEIMEYVIRNSQLVRSNDYICKVTGRLTINNINRFILLANNNETYVFTTGLNLGKNISKGIDTRFYGMPKKVYNSVFREAYLDVDDMNGNYLEQEFYKSYINTSLSIGTISFFPDFNGVSGSMGVQYKEPKWKIYAKSFMTMRGMYSPKKQRIKNR